MGLLDAIRALLGGGDDGATQDAGSLDADDPLRRYRDRWEPVDRGPGRYVVYPPEDGPSSVRRCETLDEVRRRLEHWYDEPDRD